MSNGPTQNYADPGLITRRARPVLAFAVRTAIAVGPLALALVVGAVAALLLPSAQVGLPVWLWLVGVVVTTSAVLYVCSRALRRLAPLSALLRLSLVLPDDVPHRFALARRRWSPAALQETTDREVDAVDGVNGVDADDEQPSQRLLALVATLAAHDDKTRAHAERVQAYAALIGKEMGLSADEVDRLSWAALLHDVGKVHVAPEIINKAGKPSEEEWAQLQTHPHHGGELVEPLRGWLGDWLDGVEQHHERFDGKGYPRSLAGQDISLAARIIAVADTYDVITSARSYKKPMTAEQARAEITRCAGAQFDPEVVRALLSVGIAKLRRIAGPATLLAALPVVIAAPAQAASSVGVAAQAVGGHAATAVLAASVGVAGGVTAADVLAAPLGAAVLVVQDTSGATGTTGATDTEGSSSARRFNDIAGGPGAAEVSFGESGGPGRPAATATATAESTSSAEGPGDPSAGDLATASPFQSSSPSLSGFAVVGSSDEGPRASLSSATSARGTDLHTPGPKSGSADEEAKRTAKEAQQAAEKAAKEQADRAKAAQQAAEKAAKQAAQQDLDKTSKQAAKDAADAVKVAQEAADEAARQAAKNAADAAKAAQEAADKASKLAAKDAAKAAADEADKAAKKTGETAGKLTNGLTSGLPRASSGSTSASSGAPSQSSTPRATSSSGSSSRGGLIDGLLDRGS